MRQPYWNNLGETTTTTTTTPATTPTTTGSWWKDILIGVMGISGKYYENKALIAKLEHDVQMGIITTQGQQMLKNAQADINAQNTKLMIGGIVVAGVLGYFVIYRNK